MVRVNVYLLKANVMGTFHYSIRNANIVIEKNSIFDDDAYLDGETAIRQYILLQKKKQKEIKEATSVDEIYSQNNFPHTPDWVYFGGVHMLYRAAVLWSEKEEWLYTHFR